MTRSHPMSRQPRSLRLIGGQTWQCRRMSWDYRLPVGNWSGCLGLTPPLLWRGTKWKGRTFGWLLRERCCQDKRWAGSPARGGCPQGSLWKKLVRCDDIHSFLYIRTSFIRRSGSISRKFKKILRRSRGWILENFEKIEAEMCVYYINLRRSGSIFWKIKKI